MNDSHFPNRLAERACRPARPVMFGNRRAQRGISMVELSIVLVIIAVILSAVYYGFSQNQRRAEVDENVNMITQVVGNLQGKFGKTNTYGAVTTAVAVQSNAVPDILRVVGTNTAQNSYGGAITVAPTAAGTCPGTNDCVTVVWSDVPRAQCADLVIATSRVARQISVGAEVVKALDAALGVADTATQCDAAAAADLTFVVGRGA